MFPFRKKKPKTSPVWMRWALLLFVVYALAVNFGNNHAPSPLQESLQKARMDLSGAVSVEEYAARLFPAYASPLRLKDVAYGEGAPAFCGQEARIVYEAFLENGAKIDQSAAEGVALRLGARQAIPALEKAVLGMKPGGKRSVVAPAALAYGAPGFSKEGAPADQPVRFEITLQDTSPALPATAFEPRRFDHGGGSGKAAECGDAVKANVVIWSLSGERIYPVVFKEEHIPFTIGASEVFFGLEQGVIGLATGARRTLIVPPAWQKPLHDAAASFDFHLPEQQIVLVDVALTP